MSRRQISEEELDELYDRIVPQGGEPGPREGPSSDDLEEAAERLFRGRDPCAQERPADQKTREVTDADLAEAYWNLFS